MCDICACASFSPHLWKAGVCRDCHHSIGNHALLPVECASPLEGSTITLEPPQKHSFVGKLSVDKLEPFLQEDIANPLASSNSGRIRTSIIITPSDDQGQQRSYRQSREIAFRLPGEDEEENVVGNTYGERLSASYRKSKEIFSKRRSLSGESEDKANSSEQQRGLVIEELVATERDYCRDLDYLTQVFLLPTPCEHTHILFGLPTFPR